MSSDGVEVRLKWKLPIYARDLGSIEEEIRKLSHDDDYMAL